MLISILFLVLYIRDMSFPVPGGGGGGLVPGAFAGVQTIIAGSNISVSPASGQGTVTIDASGGAAGVSQLVAGTNITLTPSSGLGTVTIDASGGVSQLVAGTNITLTPSSGLGTVTIDASGAPVSSIIAGTGITISPTNGLGDVTINATASAATTFAGYVLTTGQFYAGSGILTPGQVIYMNLAISNPFIYSIGANPTKTLYVDFKIPIYSASGTGSFNIGISNNGSSIPLTLTGGGAVSGGSTSLITPMHNMPCSQITTGAPYLYIQNTSASVSIYITAYVGNHLALVY
jgi:hypothetical protein